MALDKFFKSYNSSKPLLRAEEQDFYIDEIRTIIPNSGSIFKSRQLVFCLIDNDVGGIAGYLAILAHDSVPMMISAGVPIDKLNMLIKQYQPNYIWLPDSRVSEMLHTDCVASFSGYSLFDLKSPALKVHDELGLLLPTSGSTGGVKYVRLSQRNLTTNAEAISSYLGLDPADIPITTLPPNYSYGLSIIHSHLLVGATIAVTKKTFFEKKFWEFFRDVNATSFGGVPYHYEILKKLSFTTRMDLPSLRTLTQAGGKMNSQLVIEFATYCQAKSVKFFTMYGQTEAAARISFLSPELAIQKPGSIGRAIPGGKLWIQTDNSQNIESTILEGELIYEGPNVSMGYALGSKDLSKGDENNGILRTGDIARCDADGDYYIVGRLSRFIKLFGRRVSLSDVECLLSENGYSTVCAGVDDFLHIYTQEHDEDVFFAIKKIVSACLKISPVNISVYKVASIPRNDYGKVQYEKLSPQLGFK